MELKKFFSPKKCPKKHSIFVLYHINKTTLSS